MTDIHYFPRYSQRENFVTNNTLLLLLRLREYSRLRFEKFMESLCADEEFDIPLNGSWLGFRQQIGTGKSVVDGYISQDSVKIGVETKLVDFFDMDQLNKHLQMFGSEQHRILIMLSPSLNESSRGQLHTIRSKCAEKSVQLIYTTFENIVSKAKTCLSPHDEEMHALVEDFEDFCSDEGLLPRDQFTVFVPPCGQSYEHNIRFQLYHCPAAWNRRKTAYLGIYNDRSVRAIGRIAKIVYCTIDLQARTVIPLVEHGADTLTKDECDRLLGAAESAEQQAWDITHDTKFYLMDSLELTDFKKSTPRGIQGHRYVDLETVFGEERIPSTLPALAGALRTRSWQ